MATQNPNLKTAIKRIGNKLSNYRHFADYYRGDQDLTYASEKFLNAFGTMVSAFADNVLPSVVDPVADRLQIAGFSVEEGSEDATETAKNIWKRNRMERRAGEIHLEALKTGDAYAIVWPDSDGNPTIYPQRADQMTIEYDAENPGEIRWAAKTWMEGDLIRVNMYYSDRVEKWVSEKPMTALPADEKDFSMFDEVFHDYGRVPVFHFANNASLGEFGQSELENVIPLQDALNKSIADMLVAMEFVALPQRWATGLEVDLDPITGKPIDKPFEPGVDRLWSVANEATKFGEFAPANLEQFLKTQDSFRLEMARVSGIPFHYFMLTTGDFPSGESLKTAEVRFLSKVRDRMGAFGEVWESVMEFALRVAGLANTNLQIEWIDPAPATDKEKIEAIALKVEKLGIPKSVAWKELGYTDQEIADMVAAEVSEEMRTTQTRVEAIRAEQRAIMGDVEPAAVEAMANAMTEG